VSDASSISDIDGGARAFDGGGMHLAELLVAAALGALLFATTLAALQQGLHTYADGVARVESQQSARIALERMAHDIRQAGFGGSGTSFPAVAVVDPSQIVLQLDLNADGVIAGSGETITWRLSAGVLRRDAGGGAQPIVDGVRALTLTYLDANGAITAAPAAVRAVRVMLTTGPTHAASQTASGITTTMATEVRLRNR
jgi:Tfp pilus assembly protein PilW